MTMKTSRILFVHSGSDLYGASRSLLRLSSRLVKDGVLVRVVLPDEGPLVGALQANGIVVDIHRNLPVIERQKVRNIQGMVGLFINLFTSTFGLLRLIKMFKPELVHTMTAVILSSGLAARLAGIPHVWHVREFFGEFGGLWRHYQKYLLEFSTRIICVSTPVADQFVQFRKNEKITVLHNGFPAEEFQGISSERVEKFRAKYAPPEIQYLVGVVGRIKFQRKGQEVFVQAASLLCKKYPNARFLCIGSPFPGNEIHLENLLKLIKELNLEHFVLHTGDIEDIKAAIRGLDVLVMSSVQPEPFGGVVIEAMALARPIVATGAGGTLEQVVDGVTGYLIEPGNPKSMADGIEKLLESQDRRREFGENGYARYREKFEFEQFYRSLLELYMQAICMRVGQ